MNFLTLFCIVCLIVMVIKWWSDRQSAKDYAACFTVRRITEQTDGDWCLNPCHGSHCMKCPHYHFYN